MTSRLLTAIALIAAVFLAYCPALPAPFEFDDLASIPGNPTINRLWPLWVPLSPPANTTVSGRPVVNYSLALNYAVNEWLGVDQRLDPYGRNKTVGYRLVNILIHLVSGLLLFGIIRRTLRSRSVAETWTSDAQRTAALITAIWLLHPLQSEAVNYVVQRTELLVSACYLATLYSWIRAWDTPSERSRLGWRAAAVIACLLGMGSKEVIITVPLVLVLYDRAFRVESWKDVVSDWRRVLFYCLLAATSVATIVFTLRSSRAGTVGFHAGLGWREYLYSQAWAILHYLRLALWPDRLTFDYGQRPITGLRGVPGVVILGVAFIATSVAWIRLGRWAGLAFLGAWFFLLLAPSSSFVPIATEIAAERRIYLAFASVVTVVVIGATAAVRRLAGVRAERWATVGWVAIAALLTARTYMRSRTYANPEALWRDTVRNAPANPRAYNNLASTLFFTTPPRLAEAQELYWQAIALDSAYLPPWTGLASAAVNEGRYDDAKWMLEQALAIDPEYADAIDQLGRLYMRMGQPARAVTYLERFTKAYPSENALMILASAYMQTGRLDAAALTLREALELNPARADALRNLGGLLTEQDRFAEATPLLERALALNSSDAVAMAILSVAYAGGRRADDAARAASQAVARAPGDANVQLLAGRAMLLVGRARDAEGYLSEAARLAPSNPEAITRLGLAKRALGNEQEAEKLFRRALAADSGYAPARDALRK